MKPPTHSFQKTETRDLNFDVMDDPDYPPEAVNSNIIVEEIEMNGRIQKIYKKTYYLIDGKTINITRMEQAWLGEMTKLDPFEQIDESVWADLQALAPHKSIHAL